MEAQESPSDPGTSFTATSVPIHEKTRQRPLTKKPVVYQTCDVCNIPLAGQSVIESHMAGSKHAKKLKAQELLANLTGSQQEKTPSFRCETCDVTLNSSTQFEVHCAGIKHKNKVGGNKEEETSQIDEQAVLPSTAVGIPAAALGSTKPAGDLHCAICNVHVNSNMQLEQHLGSKKHRERESGRWPQRPTPYMRSGPRGGRGGLGSHGRGGKALPANLGSLSSSFKSAGYSNTFIKPEGGVIMPKSSSSNNGNSMNSNAPIHPPISRGLPRNKGNFGSLSPYVNSDSQQYGMNVRGGFSNRGGFHRGGWHGGNVGYGPPQGPCSGYGDPGYDPGFNSGYDYGSYENYGGYSDYNMMHAGPSNF